LRKEKAYCEGKVVFQYKHLLGYKKGEDGKPEIVPEEAETVRLIFKMYLDGYTLLNITQTLTEQQRLTAAGKNIWSKGEIQRILKANIGTVLECQGQEEILTTEKRLKEIDNARNDLVMLIASGGSDENKLDSEFAKLYQEEQQLSERLETLKSQNKTSAETQAKLDTIMRMIEHEKFELKTFDNVLIRKLIECIKVLSNTEILVIFKGGYEVKAEIE